MQVKIEAVKEIGIATPVFCSLKAFCVTGGGKTLSIRRFRCLASGFKNNFLEGVLG